MTTVATGSLADLGFQEEITYGVKPTPPTMKTFRRRSTSLNLSKETHESEEVRSDRMQTDVRHGVRRVGGDIVSEISAGSHDDAWEAVMGGAWVAGVTYAAAAGDGLTVNGATRVFTRAAGGGQSFLTDGFKVGDRIRVGAFDAAYDGLDFTVIGVTASTLTVAADDARTFTTVAVPDEDATISVLGAKVEIGNAYRSFTFERAFPDVGLYQAFTGNRFNSVQVAVPPTGIATATWAIVGKDADPMSSASFDGTAVATSSEGVLGSLTIAGGAIQCANSDFATQGFAAGSAITITGVTGIASFPTKNLTIVRLFQTTNPNDTIEVAEAVPAGTATAYTITRLGAPTYTAASTTPVMVSANGVLIVDGTPVALVSELSFGIDNQIGGKSVVGSNTVPHLLYGKGQLVSGSITLLFESATYYNKFVNEEDATLLVRMDDASGNFIQFFFPRLKLTSAEIGDGDPDGLPIQAEFRALKPVSVTGYDDSQVVIQSYAA